MEYVNRWFSKVGRGVPQTEQVDDDGKPVYLDVDGKDTLTNTGTRKTGNEQFQAQQIVPESVPSDDPGEFLNAAMEAAEGDLALVVSAFVNGFNKHLRLKAGGLDEYQKAARTIVKLGLAQFKGKTIDEIAEYLKTADVK